MKVHWDALRPGHWDDTFVSFDTAFGMVGCMMIVAMLASSVVLIAFVIVLELIRAAIG